MGVGGTRRRCARIGLLSTSALLAAVVFVAPMRAIGFEDLITTRLVYFPLFLLLMWLATVKWPLPWAIGFAVAGIGVALIGDVSRWPIDERYDARVTSFLGWPRAATGADEFSRTQAAISPSPSISARGEG